MEQFDIIGSSMAAIKRGDIETAETLVRGALEKDADNEKLLNLLGWVLSEKKQFEELITVYKRLVKLTPNQSFSLFYKLGRAYFDLKDYKSAIDAFNKTLEQVPGHKNALFYIGAAYEKLGDTRKSKKYLDRIASPGTSTERLDADGVTSQKGIAEYHAREFFPLAAIEEQRRTTTHTVARLSGVWTIRSCDIIRKDAALATDAIEGYIVVSGDGTVLLRGQPCIFIIDADEEFMISRERLSGFEGGADGLDLSGDYVRFGGPRRVVIDAAPSAAALFGENDWLRAECLVAVLGSTILDLRDDFYIAGGTGRAFFS